MTSSVEVTLRIPGAWAHPGELMERLPEGVQLSPEALVLPGGDEFEIVPMPPDDEFPGIFQSSCRDPASAAELATVRRYTVNVGLTGPGGSLKAAHNMMRAAAAIVQAGGAGVFIDNSALAHGGGHWVEMADDGSPDALSYTFVGLVGGPDEVRTTGMHVLGHPNLVMRRADAGDDARRLIEIVRYICGGEKPVGDGHVLLDEDGPGFQVSLTEPEEFPAGSPMHNPFGRFRITSLREIAEGN